jgi:hypothetical protein
MAGYRSLLSGLGCSAVVLTGLSAAASTAQTPTTVQPPSLVVTQGSTAAAAALPVIQATTSDTGTGLPTKSPTGPPVTLPDPTTNEENRANAESNAIAAIVSEMPGFGGISVDEAGITHVAVQHGKAGDFANALQKRPKGEHVLEEVDSSYNDLVSRRNSILEQIGTLKTQGLDLLEWGPDEKNNAVWVSLRNYTKEKANLARKVLGEDIIVSPATVAGDENDLFFRTRG